MPHQCTNCERVFPDGSKEMLSGCPDCGGNKFQFRPEETPTLEDPPSTSSEPSPSTSSEPPPSTTTESSTADAVPDSSSDDRPTSESTPEDPDAATGRVTDSDGEYIEAECDPSVLDEDTAQADARSDFVTRDELDRASGPSPPPAARDAARTVPPSSEESPDIDDLRAELNDQFESIKIVEPGQYELNLMELYDRQECIISLREDGHYVIEVADSWRDD